MSPELEGRFLQFWERYPKKKARIAALRAWSKLSPSEGECSSIMAGVRRYMLSGEWSNPQFIPHPATFLNGRRWEDEIGQGAHEVVTPQPRFCAICGRTGSWHSNELKHGRPVGHTFVEAIAS
jgi:hypothetical protein